MSADNDDAIPLPAESIQGHDEELRWLYAKLSAIDALIRSLQNYDRSRLPLERKQRSKLA